MAGDIEPLFVIDRDGAVFTLTVERVVAGTMAREHVAGPERFLSIADAEAHARNAYGATPAQIRRAPAAGL